MPRSSRPDSNRTRGGRFERFGPGPGPPVRPSSHFPRDRRILRPGPPPPGRFAGRVGIVFVEKEHPPNLRYPRGTNGRSLGSEAEKLNFLHKFPELAFGAKNKKQLPFVTKMKFFKHQNVFFSRTSGYYWVFWSPFQRLGASLRGGSGLFRPDFRGRATGTSRTGAIGRTDGVPSGPPREAGTGGWRRIAPNRPWGDGDAARDPLKRPP